MREKLAGDSSAEHNCGVAESPERVASDADPYIDAYLAHVKVERGLAANTVMAYASDLARFVSWLDEGDRNGVQWVEPSE